MKSLSRSDIYKWCISNGVDPKERASDKVGMQRFRMPYDTDDRLTLSNALMERIGERPLVVWITEWGVWPSVDRRDLYVPFCEQRELPHDLKKTPGFQFKRREFSDATELAGICVMSLWDVQIFGPRGKTYLYFSHDEIGGASFSLPEPFEHFHCEL